MFTGLISDVGRLLGVETRGDLKRLKLASHYLAESLTLGASVAHNGVCMTLVDFGPREEGDGFASWHEVDAAAETLAVTTAGFWAAGDRINLERSLRVGDELGGHLVSGHVDGVARLVERRDFDGMAHFEIEAPRDLARFIAEKGSVALDGASLTVNKVSGHRFTILLIPHTLEVTAWSGRKVGDAINLEVDTMARYAARLVEAARELGA
ncbi:riboflavin synthase [uncultured Rhodoblastus sp.]|uniref:riboflavin synthase n=1 Tax=uncultured Rhodoblastus sp. TaxID=543037 RepID=UPI0025F5952D|nr:riboflavin synthase [uncultured Rhodoblastus sp.]